MLRTKSENYVEAEWEEYADDVFRLKNAYLTITGVSTLLSDEDVHNIIASSFDDKEDEDWVKDMLAYEAGDEAWAQRLAEQELVDLAALERELPEA